MSGSIVSNVARRTLFLRHRNSGNRARRLNDSHLAANEIDRERRQSIVLAFRPAIFDRNILALDEAGLP